MSDLSSVEFKASVLTFSSKDKTENKDSMLYQLSPKGLLYLIFGGKIIELSIMTRK